MRFHSRTSFEMTLLVIPNAHEESHPDLHTICVALKVLLAVMRFLSRASFEMTGVVISTLSTNAQGRLWEESHPDWQLVLFILLAWLNAISQSYLYRIDF